MTAHDDAIKKLLKSHGIALTGGIGTGKSTVARLLAAQGLLVIDADQLAREVTAKQSPGLAALVQAFGSTVLAPDGSLDRRRLGALVFGDPKLRAVLEQITHPLIRAALGEHLAAAGLLTQPKRFFYEAALIFERGAESDFAAVWVTYCALEQQIQRVMARDRLDRSQAERLIASQISAKTKADRADYVIATDRPLAEIEHDLQQKLATWGALGPPA